MKFMTTSFHEFALLDSNVLVYADQRADERHAAAKTLRDRGQQGEIPLCVTHQVLNEFFAVITSRGRGGVTNPVTDDVAWAEVEKYLQSDTIITISPTATTYERLGELFRAYRPTGRRIFDLYLVATMLDNGITKIYTYNTKHFAHIAEIEVLDPSELAAMEPVPEEISEDQDEDDGQSPP